MSPYPYLFAASPVEKHRWLLSRDAAMIGTPVIGNDVEGGWVGMPPKAWHNPPLPGLRLPRRSLLRRPRDTMGTRSQPIRCGNNCQFDVPLRCYYYLGPHYQAKWGPGWLEDYLEDYLESSRERLGEAPGTPGRVGTRDSKRLRKATFASRGFWLRVTRATPQNTA